MALYWTVLPANRQRQSASLLYDFTKAGGMSSLPEKESLRDHTYRFEESSGSLHSYVRGHPVVRFGRSNNYSNGAVANTEALGRVVDVSSLVLDATVRPFDCHRDTPLVSNATKGAVPGFLLRRSTLPPNPIDVGWLSAPRLGKEEYN